jgi:hypothetical protein
MGRRRTGVTRIPLEEGIRDDQGERSLDYQAVAVEVTRRGMPMRRDRVVGALLELGWIVRRRRGLIPSRVVLERGWVVLRPEPPHWERDRMVPSTPQVRLTGAGVDAFWGRLQERMTSRCSWSGGVR